MAGRAHDARTATEARAGADVKHKLALASREIEQLDGTLGDNPLHLHVSRPLRVIACLHFIVVDLPRSCKVPAFTPEARSVTHVSAGRGAHHSTHPAGRACDANTFHCMQHTSGGALCSGRLMVHQTHTHKCDVARFLTTSTGAAARATRAQPGSL